MLGSRSLSIESIAVRVARLLAIILGWSALVALAMGYFLSPIGAVQQPTFGDFIGFASAFTITGAVAASVALVLGGKKRWAVEIALALGLTIVTTAVLAYVALWMAPWTVRSRMDAWSFLRLKHDVVNCAEAIVNFHAPMGAGLGVLVGLVAGRLIVIAGRRPQLAKWIALGMVVICAFGPVRAILFGGVSVWGMVIRRLFATTWPMTDEHVWATAAILGAITGSFVAYLSTRVPLWHRSRDGVRAVHCGDMAASSS